MSFLTNTYGIFNFVDIVAGVLLLFIIISDMRAGLIRAFGNLVGSILAIALAGRLYDDVGAWIPGIGSGVVGNVVGFVIVYCFISGVIGLIVWIIDRIFSIFKIIPGLGLLNTLGGAVIGLIKGSLVIGTVMFVLNKLQFNADLTLALQNSVVANYFLIMAKPAVLLLPDSLRMLVNM